MPDETIGPSPEEMGLTPEDMKIEKSESNEQTIRPDNQESEVTQEQQKILESAVKFTEYLNSRWPQVDYGWTPDETAESIPRINYYISGSLATMLLAKAEHFSELDQTQIPAIKGSKTREIPEDARRVFGTFARQIGDLDYVPQDHYRADPSRLKKGGGGPAFDEVPQEGLTVLRKGEGQIKVMCDPLKTYGSQRIAQIEVEGNDYFIARPDTLLAYKVVHLLESYEQKPERFNSDFSKILRALRGIYSEEDLISVTKEILNDYEASQEANHLQLKEIGAATSEYEPQVPKSIDRVLASPYITPEIQDTLEKLRGDTIEDKRI